MKPIQTVGIIGMGALGVMYAQMFTSALGKERVLVLADAQRTAQFLQDGLWYNDTLCDFQYVDAAQVSQPVDLLLFATKYAGLSSAMETCRHLVGPETTVFSIMNGTVSEPMLCEQFSPEQVIWCVAEKMVSKKSGNRVITHRVGNLALGVPAGHPRAHLDRMAAFLQEHGVEHLLPEDILTQIWAKFMCNVGINQVTMVCLCPYGGLQVEGKPRQLMIGAMKEAIAVANAEGIPLKEEVHYRAWLDIIDHFPPEGEPSMLQDRRAGRKSEVELFSGTVLRLSEKHGIPTPVNEWLYRQVAQIESQYE